MFKSTIPDELKLSCYREQYIASKKLENIERDIKASDKRIQELNKAAENAESNKQSINFAGPKQEKIEDSITELQEKIEDSITELQEKIKGYTNLIEGQLAERSILQHELAKLSLTIKTWEDTVEQKETNQTPPDVKSVSYKFNTQNLENKGEIDLINNEVTQINKAIETNELAKTKLLDEFFLKENTEPNIKKQSNQKVFLDAIKKQSNQKVFLESKLKEIEEEKTRLLLVGLKAIEEKDARYKEKLSKTLEELNNLLDGAIKEKPKNIEDNLEGTPIVTAYKKQHDINNKLILINETLNTLQKSKEELDTEITKLELATTHLAYHPGQLEGKKLAVAAARENINRETETKNDLEKELKELDAQIKTWESSVLQEKDDGLLSLIKDTYGTVIKDNFEPIYQTITLFDTTEQQLKYTEKEIQNIDEYINQKETQKALLIRSIVNPESSQKQGNAPMIYRLSNFFSSKDNTEPLEVLKKIIKDIKEKNDKKEF